MKRTILIRLAFCIFAYRSTSVNMHFDILIKGLEAGKSRNWWV